MELSKELLESLFEYKDGELIWMVSHGANKSGSIAGSIKPNGYKRVSIKRKLYYVHRIIFFMHHGRLPEYIDHIDGNKLNNKIENLREATMAENNRNTWQRKDNKSGVKGVSWSKRESKWQAQLKIDGTTKHFGYFDSIEAAKKILEINRKRFHKKFANDGQARGES